MARRPHRSAIRGYTNDFFKHLRDNAEHREEFLNFYELWLPNRNETISNLEKLRASLRTSETVCDFGIIAGGAVGLGGGIGQLANVLLTGSLNPLGVAVQCAGHGFKAGMFAAKAVEISRARTETSDLVQSDYDETRELVEMGLEFDGIFQKMRETIENIRRMTLEYTMEELMEELGTPPQIELGANAGNPQRQLVQAIRDGADNVAQVDANNVANILTTYLQHNPDVLRATQAAGQAGFDLLGLTRLMGIPIIGDWGFQHLYVLGLAAGIGADVRDIAQAIVRLSSEGSVTQDMVTKVIERYEKEKTWITRVHDRLTANQN